MMPPRSLLVFNSGSSSVKIGIFGSDRAVPNKIGQAHIDLRGKPLAFKMSEGPRQFETAMKSAVTDDFHDVIDEALDILGEHFDMAGVHAVGHRVVHGGERFLHPVLLDDNVIAQIDSLTPLAPLHQPAALRFIQAIGHLRPQLAQTASFDTAFHSTQDDLVRRFAISRALHDQGVKRYGFHGLSYKFVSREISRRGVWAGRTIIAHLGSGASLCALHDGISRDCSMGFSALDGIPMATRPGALDPGVMLYLMSQMKMSHDDIEDLLYHRSGLLGVSGISADTRELLCDGRFEAAQAIDLFCLRIAGEIGRLCATLGGLDTLVFTGGIGEHQPEIRSKIIQRLSWLPIEVNDFKNEANAEVISGNTSRIHAFVIQTNEEQIIAEEALSVLQ